MIDTLHGHLCCEYFSRELNGMFTSTIERMKVKRQSMRIYNINAYRHTLENMNITWHSNLKYLVVVG